MTARGEEHRLRIPKSWNEMPIKYLLSTPITDGPHETPDLVDEGVPFISAEAIQNGKIDFSRRRGYINSQTNAHYRRKYEPQKGDIYIVKSGATTGNSAIVEDCVEFNIWSPLAALRPDPSIVAGTFLLHVVRSQPIQDAIALN